MAEMTPQKALEILEMFLHKQCDLQRTEFAYSDIEVYCAVSMAKNALKKPLQETTEQDKALTIAFGKDGKARVLNEDYVIYCADKETFEKVKEALEKQTPKKPLEHGKYGFACPSCKQKLGIEREDISVYDMKPPEHCEPCGQALDWSDTE